MATSTLPDTPPEETNNPGQDEYDALTQRYGNLDGKDNQAVGNPTDPRGNDVAAGDASDPRGEPTKEDLASAEASPDQPTRHENQVGRGYRKSSPQLGLYSIRGRLTRRRLALGTGIAGIIITGIISIFASGPLQLIHASQILQHPFAKQNDDSSNRLTKLFRAARGNDIGETRVGVLGSKIFGASIKQLSDVGVDIERGPTGSPTKVTYNTEKLKANFPELENMTPDERASFLSEKIGHPVDRVAGSDTKFSIDSSRFDIKSLKLLTKNTLSLLDDGKIVGAIKGRVMVKFFNLPSLFHPLQKYLANKENNIANAAQRRAAQKQDEQAREAALSEGVEAEGEAAVGNIKEESNKYNSTVMKALLLTGGACFVRSVSGDIVNVNHDLVVLPSVIRATDVIAAGSQVMAGEDVSEQQVGTIVGGFSDSSGKTIWQSQGMNALQNGNTTNESLQYMDPDYQQAFSSNTTSSTINKWASSALDKVRITLPGGVHIGGAAQICSTPGLLLQGLVGIAASAASAFGEVASGGSLTPAIVGFWAAKESVSFAVAAVAMHFVSHYIINKNTVKLAANAFKGPTGGNLLAYGARAAANTTAIASGGIALANSSTTTILASNEQQQEDQEYRSTNWLARLFNPYDYRSLTAKAVDDVSPSPTQNLENVANVFTHFGSIFTHSIGSIFPQAKAASTPYNWGFPQYGIPDSVLNDKNMDDPYANADYVAGLLDGANGSKFKDRANQCFGVNIDSQTDANGKKIWDVNPASEVNPATDDYSTGNCNDSNEDWRRVIMFVFDTMTMKSAACYAGDDQSCTDIDGATSAASTSAGASLPQGSAKDLAQQIIPFINAGKVKCSSFTNNVGCSDITNTAKGTSIKGGQGCQVDALDPALLGMLLKLLQIGHTFTLSAICSDHHNDGMGGHAGGKAADFNNIDGVFMGQDEDANGTIPWTRQGAVGQQKIQADGKLLQDVVTFMPKSTGFGQSQCHDSYDFLSGYNLFNDACHHQHIQVAN